jgi:hypothetical protein
MLPVSPPPPAIYCLAIPYSGNFRMVQNFTFFADRSGIVKMLIDRCGYGIHAEKV